MTDIEKQALALVNEMLVEGGKAYNPHPEMTYGRCYDALCRAIEAHEAFRQEVSDAVEAVFAGYHDAPIPWVIMRRKLEPFIIAKPDPLVEVIKDLSWDETTAADEWAADLRAAIEKRGGKIVWGER